MHILSGRLLCMGTRYRSHQPPTQINTAGVCVCVFISHSLMVTIREYTNPAGCAARYSPNSIMVRFTLDALTLVFHVYTYAIQENLSPLHCVNDNSYYEKISSRIHRTTKKMCHIRAFKFYLITWRCVRFFLLLRGYVFGSCD